MIQNKSISYETAKLLKRTDLDILFNRIYEKNNKLKSLKEYTTQKTLNDFGYLLAPSLKLIIKHLEFDKEIEFAFYEDSANRYGTDVYLKNESHAIYTSLENDEYTSIDNAIQAALSYLLK